MWGNNTRIVFVWKNPQKDGGSLTWGSIYSYVLNRAYICIKHRNLKKAGVGMKVVTNYASYDNIKCK